MLKKYHLICFLMATASLTGCKKFLDKEPQAVTVEQNFYQTTEDMTKALNAAYDPLGWETDRLGAIYGLNFLYGDVMSDDAWKGGSGDGDQPNFHALETFTANPGMPEVLIPYQRFYEGIYRSNLVLAHINESNSDPAFKTRVAGEALFLRAYYHFELTKYYGDVPVVTKVLSPTEYHLGKTPKAQVYTQIIADLDSAASKLPEKGATEPGHADKGAAYALLARAHMYAPNPDWTKVRDNALQVINSNKYALDSSFARVFTVASENGIESIFEIQNAINSVGSEGDNGSNWANGNQGTLMNVMLRGRDNGGWGFNVPTKDLYNEFKKEKDKNGNDDPRLAATIIRNGDMIFGEAYVADSNNYPGTGFYARKYIEPKTAFGLNQSDGPSNPRIIRYADVLLMAAEAYNELGDPTNALLYLNKVRARVNMPDVSVTDKNQLRDIIWRERRVELALEGHRFFDLVRQGRAAAVLNGANHPKGPITFRAGVNEVLPIPLAEIDLSQGTITQNNGY